MRNIILHYKLLWDSEILPLGQDSQSKTWEFLVIHCKSCPLNGISLSHTHYNEWLLIYLSSFPQTVHSVGSSNVCIT